MADVKISRWPQTKDELWEFMSVIWGVKMSRKAVCEGHSAPFDAFADAYFAESGVSVWWASRGLGGKSMTLAHLALTEAVALKASVSVLGGSGEQSTNVLAYISNAWKRPLAPKYLLSSDPSKKEVKLKHGNIVRALMASQTSVRGPHPERLRLDEADEMEIPILNASLGQPISRNGIKSHTVIASTRQYAGGTMDYVLNEAKLKGWPVFQWCYKENLTPHGWLTLEELERTKNRITKAMWESEYELQEPPSDGRAIQTDCIEMMFDANLGVYEGAPDQYLEFEPPILGGIYITGADWAKNKDWTVISTWRQIDKDKWKRVAWERTARQAWPLMISKFNRRVFRYPGKSMHDITGIGGVIDDYIIIPATQAHEGVWLQGQARADIFNDYIAAVESGCFISPRIEYAYEQHKHLKLSDLYGSGSQDHPPDAFIADAIAFRARSLNQSEASSSSVVVTSLDRRPQPEYRDPRYD